MLSIYGKDGRYHGDVADRAALAPIIPTKFLAENVVLVDEAGRAKVIEVEGLESRAKVLASIGQPV